MTTRSNRGNKRGLPSKLRRVRPDHDVAQALGEELGRGALLLRRLS